EGKRLRVLLDRQVALGPAYRSLTGLLINHGLGPGARFSGGEQRFSRSAPAWARRQKICILPERCRVLGIEVSYRVAPPSPQPPSPSPSGLKTLAPSGPRVFYCPLRGRPDQLQVSTKETARPLG